MASVSEVGGCYVSSSIPKMLMLPLALKRQKGIKQEVTIKHNPNEDFNNTLYAVARPTSRNSERFEHAVSNRKRVNNFGDSDCPPISGREHITVQTDLYLEELCDAVEEIDGFSQTDPMFDRPASPIFVPAKIGVDVSTQIWTGDLFDFDEEVQPLLESLVSETIEQSLIEIVTDQELKTIQEQQKEYEVRRNAELSDRLRLQEQERRLLEERQNRLKEQEESVKLEEETTEKIAACVYAQNYLSDLLPKVYKRLEAQGYFATQVPEIQQVEEDFWPWLMKEVDSEITTLDASCCLLDSLIEDAVQNVTESAIIRPATPDLYPKTKEEPKEINDLDVPDSEQAEDADLIEET